MRAYRKLAIHRRVVVNLTSGEAISGVLLDERGPLIVIADAQINLPGSTGWTPVDGQQLIERTRISFVQAL